MKTPSSAARRLGWLLFGGLMLAPVLATAGILDLLTSKNELEAITVTDMTKAGSLRRSPTPEHPVYFVAVSAGYRDLGGIKAGDKPVPRQVVNQTMLKVLAKQGYLPAIGDQVPDIVIVWSWGTLYAELSPLSSMQVNHQQMVRFMGGAKFGLGALHDQAFPEQTLMPGLTFGGDVGRLADVARDDLYMAVINAYDVRLSDDKGPVLLWNTRISCPSRGAWLPDAMPAMLAMAAPHIGRETTKPVWVRATEKFRPEVQLGDPKVVEYIERANPKVIEIGPSR
jgi:hypothetical protein